MAARAQKTEPKETRELIPIVEIARRCGINRQTCAARLDDLGFEPDDSSTAKMQLYWFDDEMLFSIKAAKDSLSAAKIRDTRAAAQIKELKLAKERGELVPMGEVVDLSQRLTKALYDEFAVRMQKRVAGQLVKAKTVAAVRKILKTDADRVFKLVRTNFERYIDG